MRLLVLKSGLSHSKSRLSAHAVTVFEAWRSLESQDRVRIFRLLCCSFWAKWRLWRPRYRDQCWAGGFNFLHYRLFLRACGWPMPWMRCTCRVRIVCYGFTGLKVVLIHCGGIHLCEEKVAGGFPSPTKVQVFTPRGGGVTSDVSTRGAILNPLPLSSVLLITHNGPIYMNMVRVVNN